MALPLPSYKDIIELIKKGATLEAQEKILELREAAIHLQEENQTLKQRVKELEEEKSIRENLIWNPPYYWLKSGEKKDGPFCQTCWDKEQKLIRLQKSGERGYWVCKVCKNGFDEKIRDGDWEDED